MGRLSTVGLLVLSSLDELFIVKMLFYFITKQATLNEEAKYTEPPLLVFTVGDVTDLSV